MGYTHYWKTQKVLHRENFEKVVQDFRKVLPVINRLGIKLAGWNGKGVPEINNKRISFNGLEKCGHINRNLGITWPSKEASGISLAHTREEPVRENTLLTVLCGEKENLSLNDSDVSGNWFAGANLNKRTCGGDCSHESFILEKHFKPEEWQEPEQGKYFNFCKTAYKPYDLAVNICLIIAKHHLKDQIEVSSDGNLCHWRDAMFICHKLLKYGLDFKLDD